MKTINQWRTLFLLVFVLVKLSVTYGGELSYAENPALSKVVFYVQ